MQASSEHKRINLAPDSHRIPKMDTGEAERATDFEKSGYMEGVPRAAMKGDAQREGRGGDHPHVVALPPLIYLAFLLAGVALDFIWPTSIGSRALRLVGGAVFVVAALAILASALRRFAAAGTPVEVYRPTTALVTEGPYRYSRNPIYLALTLGSAGVAFAANSLWALLLLVAAIAFVRYGVIAREERYLEQKFGQEYLRYKASVRRWL